MSSSKPENDDIWSRFSTTVARHPERVAFHVGEDSITFRALEKRSIQFGRAFRTSRVAAGDRVIVCVEANAETAAAILGCWACGAIPILIDASERGANVDHAIATATPRLLVRSPSLKLPPLEHDCPTVIHYEAADGEDDDFVSELVAEDAPASILFTSGSTGRPKGVTQTHGSLIRANNTVAAMLGIESTDRIVCPIPWSFDYGYGQFLTTILQATTQILPTSPDPAGLCRAIDAHRPTILPGIPSLFTFLFRGPVPFRETNLSSLRIVTNTGGAIPAKVLEEMLEAFGHCSMFMNYGLTESYRTSCLIDNGVYDRPLSIGKAIDGVEIMILRPDGTRAEPGEVGEIVHRGDYLFKEYWNDPEATARALRPDPTLDGADSAAQRVLFTGDLGYADDEGFFYFHGRNDRQIKSMGVRVNPNSIEEMLYASGLLREVAVFSRPNDLMGQEIWAALVPMKEDPTVSRKLAAYAHQSLSKFMKPRRFLVKEVLPKTKTGKIDYIALEAEADESPSASLLR